MSSPLASFATLSTSLDDTEQTLVLGTSLDVRRVEIADLDLLEPDTGTSTDDSQRQQGRPIAVFISNAGSNLSNGLYLLKGMTNSHPRYVKQGNFTGDDQRMIRWDALLRTWIMDEPGHARYRLVGEYEDLCEFPVDGEWVDFESGMSGESQLPKTSLPKVFGIEGAGEKKCNGRYRLQGMSEGRSFYINEEDPSRVIRWDTDDGWFLDNPAGPAPYKFTITPGADDNGVDFPIEGSWEVFQSNSLPLPVSRKIDAGSKNFDLAPDALGTRPLGLEPAERAKGSNCLPSYKALLLDGWKLVRHCPARDEWHHAADNLFGSASYGNPPTENDPNGDDPEARQWSKKFEADEFDEFLFATGDGSQWMIVSRAEIDSWVQESHRLKRELTKPKTANSVEEAVTEFNIEGAGDALCNGMYKISGTYDDRPRYVKTGGQRQVCWNKHDDCWMLDNPYGPAPYRLETIEGHEEPGTFPLSGRTWAFYQTQQSPLPKTVSSVGETPVDLKPNWSLLITRSHLNAKPYKVKCYVHPNKEPKLCACDVDIVTSELVEHCILYDSQKAEETKSLNAKPRQTSAPRRFQVGDRVHASPSSRPGTCLDAPSSIGIITEDDRSDRPFRVATDVDYDWFVATELSLVSRVNEVSTEEEQLCHGHSRKGGANVYIRSGRQASFSASMLRLYLTEADQGDQVDSTVASIMLEVDAEIRDGSQADLTDDDRLERIFTRITAKKPKKNKDRDSVELNEAEDPNPGVGLAMALVSAGLNSTYFRAFVEAWMDRKYDRDNKALAGDKSPAQFKRLALFKDISSFLNTVIADIDGLPKYLEGMKTRYGVEMKIPTAGLPEMRSMVMRLAFRWVLCNAPQLHRSFKAIRRLNEVGIYGDDKWSSIVKVGDGRLFFVPYNADEVQVLNPLTGISYLIPVPTELIGAREKFGNATLGADGCVYCVPAAATVVLKIDPTMDFLTLMSIKLPPPPKSHLVTCKKGHVLIESVNQRSEFSCDRPDCEASIEIGSPMFSCKECNYDVCDLCFLVNGDGNPVMQAKKDDGFGSYFCASKGCSSGTQCTSCELWSITFWSSRRKRKWGQGALGNDGVIYCAPCDEAVILCIDSNEDNPDLCLMSGVEKVFTLSPTIVEPKSKPSAPFVGSDGDGRKSSFKCSKTISDIFHRGSEHSGPRRWWGAAFVPSPTGRSSGEGSVYFFPHKSHRVLKLDLKSQSAIIVGNEVDERYYGACVMADSTGEKFVVSAGRKAILLRTSDDSISLVPLPDPEGGGPQAQSPWRSTLLGVDGLAYGIPHGGGRLVQLDLSNDPAKLGSLVGDEIKKQSDFGNGALADDGFIYAPPMNANRPLRLLTMTLSRPKPGEVSTIMWLWRNQPEMWFNGLLHNVNGDDFLSWFAKSSKGDASGFMADCGSRAIDLERAVESVTALPGFAQALLNITDREVQQRLFSVPFVQNCLLANRSIDPGQMLQRLRDESMQGSMLTYFKQLGDLLLNADYEGKVQAMIKSWASVPNVVATLLEVQNESVRGKFFDLLFVQRILVMEATVGDWLVDWIKPSSGGSDPVLKRSRALEYLTRLDNLKSSRNVLARLWARQKGIVSACIDVGRGNEDFRAKLLSLQFVRVLLSRIELDEVWLFKHLGPKVSAEDVSAIISYFNAVGDAYNLKSIAEGSTAALETELVVWRDEFINLPLQSVSLTKFVGEALDVQHTDLRLKLLNVPFIQRVLLSERSVGMWLLERMSTASEKPARDSCLAYLEVVSGLKGYAQLAIPWVHVNEEASAWGHFKKLGKGSDVPEFGGTGQEIYNDGIHPNGITRVEIRSGLIVDAIKVYYTDGYSSHHGGLGGNESTFSVDDGDYITKVVIGYDSPSGSWSGLVNHLQFTTKAGKQSQMYGSELNGEKTKAVEIPEDHMLAGIKGSCDTYLSSIGFLIAKMPTIAAKKVNLREGDTVTFKFDDSKVETWDNCPGSRLSFFAGYEVTVLELRGNYFTSSDFTTLWAPINAVTVAKHAFCQNKHKLEDFTTPYGGFFCDVCREGFPEATLMHSCRPCNFDMCQTCCQKKLGDSNEGFEGYSETGQSPTFSNGAATFSGRSDWSRGYLCSEENFSELSFEAFVTITLSSGFGGSGCAFVGIGDGRPSESFWYEPKTPPSFYLRLAPEDFGGRLSANSSHGREVSFGPAAHAGDGSHRVRFSWNHKTLQVSLAMHAQYVSGPFTPTWSTDVNIAESFDSSNCRFFFGGAGNARFVDLSCNRQDAKNESSISAAPKEAAAATFTEVQTEAEIQKKITEENNARGATFIGKEIMMTCDDDQFRWDRQPMPEGKEKMPFKRNDEFTVNGFYFSQDHGEWFSVANSSWSALRSDDDRWLPFSAARVMAKDATTKLNWTLCKDEAEAKGGRLMTVTEAQDFVQDRALFPNEVYWAAVTANEDTASEQKFFWIQVGHTPEKNRGTIMILDDDASDAGATFEAALWVPDENVFFKSCLDLDQEVRTKMLQTPLVQKMMARTESVGPWIVSRLRDEEQRVSMADYFLAMPGDEKHDALSAAFTKRVAALPKLLVYLLPLDDAVQDKIVSKRLVVEVMNSKLADRPAAVGIVVADICLMFLWAVLFLSLTTNRVIVENRRAPYGYAVSLGFISVYFLGRELYTLYIFRKLNLAWEYWTDWWNWNDFLCCALTLVTVALTGGSQEIRMGQVYRGVAAAANLSIWVKFLSVIKVLSMRLATYVYALELIIFELFEFLFVMMLIIVAYAMGFFILEVQKGAIDEYDLSVFTNNGPSFVSSRNSILTTYLMLFNIVNMGMFQNENDSLTMLSVVLFVAFMFLAQIVMLNVLIAVVSDTYDFAIKKARSLFHRTRLECVAEIDALIESIFPSVKPKGELHVSRRSLLRRCSSATWKVVAPSANLRRIMYVFASVTATAASYFGFGILITIALLLMAVLFSFGFGSKRTEAILSLVFESTLNPSTWLRLKVVDKDDQEEWEGRLRHMEFQTKTIVEELVVRSEKSINETLQRSDVKAQGLVQDSEKALEDFVRKCVSDSEARLERQLAESEARTKKYLAELIQKLSAQPGAK